MFIVIGLAEVLGARFALGEVHGNLVSFEAIALGAVTEGLAPMEGDGAEGEAEEQYESEPQSGTEWSPAL